MDADFAQLGVADQKAKADGYAIGVVGWPYYENDRARAERMTRVNGRGVTDRRDGIPNARIAEARAGEVILPRTVAATGGHTIGAMSRIVGLSYARRDQAAVPP
jgi:hypothetical protein